MNSQDYQNLTDPNSNSYFKNKRIRQYLIKAGLINRQGAILPPVSYEVTLARQTKRKHAKGKLSYTIADYVIQEERKHQVFLREQFDLAIKRSRVQKIRESKHQKQPSITQSLVQLTKRPKNRNTRTSSPTIAKVSSIRAKSACHSPINVKNQVIHRPMTAKQQLNDDNCQVTMIYYGPPKNIDRKNTWYQPNGDEIVVMQQHCGGENLIVFRGLLRPNETFTFDSRRHLDYPFALAIYINGLIDSRISVCCEYKHKHNVRLGSKYGLFGIYDVQKSQPCRACRFEQRKKKILSTISADVNPFPYQKSILTSEFRPEAILRTPIITPEKKKTSSNKEINRISTVVQASQSPRRLSSASSQNKDEPKKDDIKTSSRASSNISQRSDPSVSNILSKNDQPHHSSEPILTRNNDDDESSNISRPSNPSPIHFYDDEDEHLLIENKNTNDYSTRSSSSTTLKQLSPPSSNSFSENEDEHFVSKLLPSEADTTKQVSRSSSQSSKISDSSLKNKMNEKIIKEKNSPISSSSSDAFDYLALSNKQPDSPEINENIHQHESHQSSINSQQRTEKTDAISNDRRKESEKTPARQYRAVENIILVWLDDTNTDIINSKFQLRQITRTLRTFNDPTKCFQLFKEIKNEKIFLMISGNLLSETILQQIDNYPQVVVIYIYCQEKSQYEYLINQYSKIKGIYSDVSTICQYLKIDSKQWDNDLNTFQISSNLNLFIQNQLFKNYLLDIQYEKNSIENFLEYCQKLYNENENELEIINQFRDNYKSNQAINWYTKDCFIYHILNKAIRIKDIKILFQIGFFIQDINQQLLDEYSATVYRSTLTVFRGQGIKMEYFEELKENQGGFLSFNGFVSTSKKQNVAYEFAQRSLSNGFPIAVLFRIKIDPKTTSTPFISLENFSSYPSEYEILLSFKAIFYIEKLEQIENNLWQIDLILTDDIFPYIENENKNFNHLNDYEKLGGLLMEMNELDKAKDLYEINLPNNSNPKYTYVYNQLALISTILKDYNQAILYYNLSLQTKSNEILNDYIMISNIHKEIGKIFYKQNKFQEALEKFQYALNIQLEHLSSTDLSLINTYDLLAMSYEKNDDYQTALEYCQKQLDLQEQSSLSTESDIALTHFKIAICLENLNRLDEAMDHIQQSIDISPSDDDLELNNRQAILERICEKLE